MLQIGFEIEILGLLQTVDDRLLDLALVLLGGNKWYEHEGFISKQPKNAFRNMLNDGLKQSDKLIIDKPDLTDAYMKRVIRQRVKDGQAIKEVWIKEGEKITLLIKFEG